MKRLTTILLVLALWASPVLGGPLKVEQVSGDARWLAHADVALLLQSGLAKFILSEAQRKEGFLEGLAKFREAFGFDVLRDVHGVTLYSDGNLGDDTGVVILDATVDKDKLLGLMAQNQTHREIQHGDHVLHQWTDPPEPVKDPQTGETTEFKPAKTSYGAFHGDRAVVIASSLGLLKKAIDVLDGKAEDLTKTKALPALPDPVKGVFLVAVAEELKAPAKPDNPGAAVLRNLTDISVQLGEVEAETFLHVAAVAPDAEQALKLRQFVQGMVALWQLMMQERQDLPVLGEKVAVNGTEKSVTVDVAVATDALIEMVKFMDAKKKAAAARRQGQDAPAAPR